MSKQWENNFVKWADRGTPSYVRAYRAGYSGSNAIPQPDVHVTDIEQNYDLELKGPIQGDYCRVEPDDCEQIAACDNATTTSALVVKFSRRRPVVVRYYDAAADGSGSDLSAADKLAAATPEVFDPRVTDSGVLALTKPSTEEWESSSAMDAEGLHDDTTSVSKDVEDVLGTLGVPWSGG